MDPIFCGSLSGDLTQDGVTTSVAASMSQRAPATPSEQHEQLYQTSKVRELWLMLYKT